MRAFSLTVAAAAFFMLASPAAGQMECRERTDVLTHLAKKYKEAPIAVGLANTGNLVEVLTTDDGETWTIIVSTPDGLSCLVAAGKGWRTIPFVPPKPEQMAL